MNSPVISGFGKALDSVVFGFIVFNGVFRLFWVVQGLFGVVFGRFAYFGLILAIFGLFRAFLCKFFKKIA